MNSSQDLSEKLNKILFEYTIQDFVKRIKALAKKHDVEITHLDISKGQIYFDSNIITDVKFAAGLNALIEDFRQKAPIAFHPKNIINMVKTEHGWVTENEYLNTINKKGEE